MKRIFFVLIALSVVLTGLPADDMGASAGGSEWEPIDARRNRVNTVAMIALGSWAVVNIGTGQGQSVRQVVEAVESALGRPLQVVQTQGRVRRVERQQLVADVGRLRSHTGWRPEVTFGQGIAALLADNGNGAARTGRRATTPASR